jgi:hypothetical protein
MPNSAEKVRFSGLENFDLGRGDMLFQVPDAPEPGTGVRQVLDYGPAAPPKED